MSASIASTSASSDSTPGSKTSFKDLVESLDSLRDRIEKNKISKPWSNRMPQFEVLKEQLKRLQDKNLEEGISTGNVAQTQLPGIWRWLGKDVEKPGCPGVVSTASFNESDTVREMRANKKSNKT